MMGYITIFNTSFYWLDIVLVCIIILYAIEGFREGLLHSLVNLVTFVLSFLFAIQLYAPVGTFIASHVAVSEGIAKVIGFFLIAFLTEVSLSFAAAFLIRIMQQRFSLGRKVKKATVIWYADHVFGVIPAVLSAGILLAFIFSIILALPFAPFLKQSVASSKIATGLVSKTQGFEKTSRNVFGGAVNDTLTFLTIEPKSNESIQLRFTTTNVTIDEASEKRMLDLVNQERVKAGVGPVSFEKNLTLLARNYSKDMFARGFFSHYDPEGRSPFDRMEEAGITYLAAGENLALAPSVDLAMQGLMQSPGHRANILSKDFGRIGIGVIDGGIYGKMFTQEFTD